MSRLQLWVAVSVLCCASSAAAVPDAVYPIRDDAKLLKSKQRKRISSIIASLERQTTAEIGVLIIDSTGGRNHHSYAVEVFNHWGVGKADKNNGVLLLFAMKDRRMELVPGDGFQSLFTKSRSEALLKSLVVPKMKAGRAAQGIEEAVAEVAARIRGHLGVSPKQAEAGKDAPPPATSFGSGRISPVALLPKIPTGLPDIPSPSANASPQGFAPSVSRPMVWTGERIGIVLATVAWLIAMIGLLMLRYRQVKWVVKPLLWLGAVGGPILIGMGAFAVEPVLNGLTGGVGLALLSGGVIFGLTTRHSCPECQKWMSISSHTLTAATTFSTGSGERTYSCSACGYHYVTLYTISMISDSDDDDWSSGSSFGGGGGSFGGGGGSFGGGSSSGGGGGASW